MAELTKQDVQEIVIGATQALGKELRGEMRDMEGRLVTKIDERIEQSEEFLAGTMVKEVERIDQRFERMDGRFDRMEGKFDALRIDVLEVKSAQAETAHRSEFLPLRDRVELLERKVFDR